MKKIGRNDPCPCGSGMKFKRCHLDQPSPPAENRRGLKIELVAGSATSGRDEADDNPLARATRILREDGRPFVNIAPATFVDSATAKLHWFGMFVLSASGRLVFFPGFSEEYNCLASSGNARGAGKYDKSFALDHVTLEANLATWHFSQRKGRHEHGGQTVDLGHNRMLWFGMTIKGPDVLREMAATTVALGKTPTDQETQRRIDTFLNAVRDARPAEIPLPSKPDGPCVLHFAVIVAPPGAPLYAGSNIAIGGGYVSTGQTGSNAGKIGIIKLEQNLELQVMAIWLPGSTSEGVIFTPAVARGLVPCAPK